MLRVLTFDPYKADSPDAAHKRFFDMIWFAIMAQGDPRQGGSRGRAEVKKNRRIKAEFREAGQRLPSAPDGIEGRDSITLNEQGAVVTLAEDDFKRVLELMEQVPWKGGNLDDVDDAFTWLDKVPHVKAKEVKAALEKSGESAPAAVAEAPPAAT